MATENKKKIFLVDDEEISLEIAETILKRKYEITTAKSGKEALEKLLKGGIIPHLILLDIKMPNMDGWETFNRLKAISFLKDIPIAFLTILDGKSEKDHARKIGASDFITKPYEKDALYKRIDAIINKHE